MAENIFTFCLPDIGEGVVEGEVVRWLKKEGDDVKQDEPVVLVMTDKATVELPTPYPGTVAKHYYKEGEIAIKDKPLFDIRVDASVKIPVKQPLHEYPKMVEKAVVREPIEIIKHVEAHSTQTLATPKVRHLAREWGIDIEAIEGSGKDGRVMEKDLHHAYAPQVLGTVIVEMEGDKCQPLIGGRRLMAQRMNKRHMPQFSFFEYAEATHLIEMKERFKEKAKSEGIALSYMPFLIRALSMTISKIPALNASIDMKHERVFLHHTQNIGIAMASEQGLIVPVLKHVEKMSLNDLIRAYEQLKERAHTHKLTGEDMKEATISISNFGAIPGEGMWATPLIVEPEAAILAVGRMRKVPLVKGDQIAIKEVFPFSWSFDHRLIDGELAAHISHTYVTFVRDAAFLL